MTLATDGSISGQLYREHEHWLRRWLYRRLGCRDDAADLAQDVFVRVLVSPHTPALLEPRAFLTTLAQRVLARFWRRRDLERAWIAALEALPVPLVPSPEEVLESQQLLDRLDRSLGTLKPAAREAFLLHRVDGLTQVEVAARIGRSVATVERYLRDAYLCIVAQQLSSADV